MGRRARGLMLLGAAGVAAAAGPMLIALAGNSAPAASTAPAARPLVLTPDAGPAGSTFATSFPCNGLATLAVTTETAPPTVVYSDVIDENVGDAHFVVPVPADQPVGVLKVVGVCATSYSGYGGDDGYDGYDGYNGCGYDGYEGYNGYDGYNCAVITFGPAFFTVTPPPVPSLSIDDVFVTETDGGAQPATFTISLSSPLPHAVKVKYATVDGTATDGKPGGEQQDYRARSAGVTLPPGTTSKTIDIPVRGDTIGESNEQFTVVLSDAEGAPISDGTGVGTIVDNNDPVMILANDATIVEGDSGHKTLAVTLHLSRPSDTPVRVKYATVDGTATDGKPRAEGKDYSERSNLLTFNRGSIAETVNINIVGDTLAEGNETFTLVLSDPVHGGIADGSATITIIDNE